MSFRVIGQSLPRIDAREKVLGSLEYTADLSLRGQLHARLVLSPHPHARITRIAKESALRLPGVVAVLAASDLPLANADSSSRLLAPLAGDRALFHGHPVAAVLAEDEAVAEDGVALVEVDYEELPAAVDPEASMAPGAPLVQELPVSGQSEELAMHGAESGSGKGDSSARGNIASQLHLSMGDVEAGFRKADLVIEHTYSTSVVHQAYLEPQAAIARVDALGGVTVWASTQALFYARSQVAAALGLPEHRVRIIAMPVGGAFGGKFVLLEPLAACLSAAVRRPVRLILTRQEDFLATNPAPQSRIHLRVGVRRDGRLTALKARVVLDAGAFPGAPLGLVCDMLGNAYRFSAVDIQGFEVLTHKLPNGAYRAPGAVQATFALESHIDELAQQLGHDPLELRLRNVPREGDAQLNRRKWPPIAAREVLERLRDERRLRADGQGADNIQPGSALRSGWGVSSGNWTGAVEPASALCRLEADGSLTVVVGSVDLSGTNTGLAQIAAEASGLLIENIRLVNADTDSAPYVGATGGSKIISTVGAAVKRAAEDARQQLLAIAADRLEVSTSDLELTGERVQVRGAAARSLELAEIAELSTAYRSPYEPVLGRGSSARTDWAPVFAAHLARVEVDTESGVARVTDHVVVQDVGRVLNPALVQGQIQGAVAQGVGWALLERMAYDEAGRIQTASFMDYAVPGAGHVPNISSILLEAPSRHGPFGAKAVGEPPVIAAAAAIANALRAATGVRFTSLPITAETIAFRRTED